MSRTRVKYAPYDEFGNLCRKPFEGRRAAWWKPNKPFKRMLALDGKFRSSNGFYVVWIDVDGRKYPMFAADLVGLVEDGRIVRGACEGAWMVTKRGGEYYGLRLAKESEV